MFLAITERPAHAWRGQLPPTSRRASDRFMPPLTSTFMPLVPQALPRATRRVDPYIHALHQPLGQVHVVVTEEHRMRARFGPPNKTQPFLNQRSSGLVRGMRFSRDDQLHRTLRIAEYAQQPARIMQQQVRTFVSRKAARKSQRQNVRVEQILSLSRLLQAKIPMRSIGETIDRANIQRELWLTLCESSRVHHLKRNEFLFPEFQRFLPSVPFRRRSTRARQPQPNPNSAYELRW